MSEPSALEPLVRAEPSAVLHCMGCRYDLTGLDPTGKCPECAVPIADSRTADLLRTAYGGPVLRKSLRVIFACLAARSILELAVVASSLAVSMALLRGAVPFLLPLYGLAVIVTTVELIELVGWFGATSQAVTTWFRGSRPWAEFTRWGLLMAAIAAVVAEVTPFLVGSLGWIASFVASLVTVVARGAQVGYVHRLGLHPPIGERHQRTLWIAYLAFAIATIASVVAYVAMSMATRGIGTTAGLIRWILLHGLDVLFLILLAIRIRFIASTLREEPRSGR